MPQPFQVTDHYELIHFALVKNDEIYISARPEMELLDINLTKDSSLLLHAIHSISIGGF
jgi:hypothetical protein